mmetsp:Transcript_41095/g.131464  ORF Transcript_41095/g.131464 Transcript_41095/m.131464 type:complete len:451 (+) Transcript_41095:116-1468(+)
MESICGSTKSMVLSHLSPLARATRFITSSSLSLVRGLDTYPVMPRLWQSARTPRATSAVHARITGGRVFSSVHALRILSHASRPSMTGICRSMSTMSYCLAAHASTASRPLFTTSATRANELRSFIITRWLTRLSSATRMARSSGALRWGEEGVSGVLTSSVVCSRASLMPVTRRDTPLNITGLLKHMMRGVDISWKLSSEEKSTRRRGPNLPAEHRQLFMRSRTITKALSVPRPSRSTITASKGHVCPGACFDLTARKLRAWLSMSAAAEAEVTCTPCASSMHEMLFWKSTSIPIKRTWIFTPPASCTAAPAAGSAYSFASNMVGTSCASWLPAGRPRGGLSAEDPPADPPADPGRSGNFILVLCMSTASTVKWKMLPRPAGFASTHSSPPIFSTSHLTMVSPSPVPPCLRVREESTCWNAMNIRCFASSLIPIPVSVTLTWSLQRAPK